MKIANLLADALDCASRRLRTGTCGMTDDEMETALHRMLYMLDSDRHFTEDTARPAIARMFYFSDETHKVYAPFFPYDEVRASYDAIRPSIPDDYNFWDFCVTVNLMYSNHVTSLHPKTTDRTKLLSQSCSLALNFLLDEDTDHPTDKIWWYINS